ncbi:MAG: DUF3850 domain-containing protein [Candidatus Veblenbacteria bacterium]|nr:DUF3850 domain-containing protein [Candidatus Veblenbacteria bacterium]
MPVIHKKAWPELFEAVRTGKKKFDLRLNDVEIAEGDTLVLEEWDPQTKAYTGRKLEKRVTYALKFKVSELWWPEEEVHTHGLQIISLE